MRYLLFVLLGTAFEWLDYSILISITPLLSKILHQDNGQHTSLFLEFGIFFSGFVARPIGAVVLGVLADNFGRNRILKVTIFCMSLSCLAIALIPVHTIPPAASLICFIGFRILHGFFASAEFPVAMTILYEFSATKKWMASLSTSCVVFGMLLGTTLYHIVYASMPESEFLSYGWRILFFIGGILGFLVFIFRTNASDQHLLETPGASFQEYKKFIPAALYGSLMMCFTNSAYYLCIVYLPITFLKDNPHLIQPITLSTSLNMLLISLLIPTFAVIFKNYRQAIIYISLSIFCFFIAYLGMTVIFDLQQLFICQLILAMLMAAYGSVVPTVIPACFPKKVRATMTGISINVIAALLGGVTPLLLDYSHTTWAPQISSSLFFLLIVILSFVGFRKAFQISLRATQF